MEISRSTAEQIIVEINKIIPYKINIMSHDGLIIASSDKHRVNEVHMGARNLIEQHFNELRIYENEEYHGGKPGTNFPIIVSGEVVGVIGITGDYDQICSYAKIIKRMTEILLLEEKLKKEQMQKVYKINSFLYEWIHAKTKQHLKELYEKGIVLGIDINKKRRFICMKTSIEMNEEGMADIEHYLRQKLFGDNDSFILRKTSSFFLSVHDSSDYEINLWFQEIQKELSNMLSCTMYIGVDERVKNHEYIYTYYQQSKQALQAAIYHDKPLYFYKNVTMDIFIEEVSYKAKSEFINKIFKKFTNDEIEEVLEILKCYYHYNGSIQKASKALFLHKNTLQNRLNRIKERTGFDPRALQDIPLFSIAIHFYQYQESQL